MNIRRKSLLILLVICPLTAMAQQSGTMTLGVQQAIDIALKNRYDIQSRKFNVTIANNGVDRSKREWVPDISASGNVRYSQKIQATYVPGGFVPAAPDPVLVALGAKNVTIFGLDLNQPLYKPGISMDVKLARINAALSEERLRQDENIIKEQVLYAYLNVLLKNLQKRIALQEEHRQNEYTQVAEGRFKAGTMIETDYLKATLDYENAKVESQKTEQDYQLALENVKYQINLQAEIPIVLIDTLNSAGLAAIQVGGEGDANSRTEIKQLKIQQEGSELEIARQRQNAIPSVSLYGNYSRQFTYTNFDYTLGKWWSNFNYVGLKVSVPITSNFRNYNTIEESRMKALQAALDLKQKTADVNYEIQKTSTELGDATQNMQTTKKNYDLSKEVYENQRQQYNLGARQYNDLLETNRSLNLAEQNYIKAVYDYLVANVNYQKAIGNF